jgi:hypothetical protein
MDIRKLNYVPRQARPTSAGRFKPRQKVSKALPTTFMPQLIESTYRRLLH